MTAPQPRRGFKWRKWNNLLHRDLGYLAVGLTLVYAISGVAVNHIDDWNPSYRFVRQQETFQPLEVSDRQTLVNQLVEVLELPGPPKESFRTAPHEVQLFYEGWSVEADVTAGTAVVERPRQRVLLRDFNRLHLNQPGGLWTWAADAYAGILAFLAISGMFMLKGKKGLKGRGKWLVGAGLLIPVVAILLARILGGSATGD